MEEGNNAQSGDPKGPSGALCSNFDVSMTQPELLD